MDGQTLRRSAARQAAQILVTTMPTRLWPLARVRITRLLGKGDAVRERLLVQELELARAAVLTSDSGDDAADRWLAEFVDLADHYAPLELRSFTDTFEYLLQVIPHHPQ